MERHDTINNEKTCYNLHVSELFEHFDELWPLALPSDEKIQDLIDRLMVGDYDKFGTNIRKTRNAVFKRQIEGICPGVLDYVIRALKAYGRMHGFGHIDRLCSWN